jgi:hypothetical protein
MSLAARTPERATIIGNIVNRGESSLTIQEPDGRTHEIQILPATRITRNAQAALFEELRIGDAVTAETNQARLTAIQAIGGRSTTQGRITEIRITEHITEITIANEENQTASFFIFPDVTDVYTLRIGATVNLDLDSREVLELF